MSEPIEHRVFVVTQEGMVEGKWCILEIDEKLAVYRCPFNSKEEAVERSKQIAAHWGFKATILEGKSCH